MVGRRTARGFTLIELITVVAVMAVLVTLAVPSLQDMVYATRVRSAASDLLAAVMLARSEAIKRQASVSVTPGASGWADGWTIATGGTTIETHEALTGVSVDANVGGSITYKLDGRLSTNVRLLTVYTTESANPVTARCIAIDASGRPTIRNDSDSNYANGC